MDGVENDRHAAYRAAREAAALLSLPGSDHIRITGPERAEYLNGLCTNRIVGLEAGQAARAFLLVPTKGRVLADFLAAETGSSLELECFGGSAPTVLELLGKYYFGQDVAFEDRSSEVAVLSLQGPASPAVLETVGVEPPAGEEGSHREAEIAGAEGRVVRWSDIGEIGFHLWVPADRIERVASACREAGATAADAETWTVLQIEAGVAVYGRELTDEVIPLEAPVDGAIDHAKGCYPGQEVIARLHVRGRPARHLRGLRVDAGEPLPVGTELDAADKAGVARVTASGTSPELGSIALAFVHRDHVAAGTRLEGAGRVAEVADLPMVPVRA